MQEKEEEVQSGRAKQEVQTWTNTTQLWWCIRCEETTQQEKGLGQGHNYNSLETLFPPLPKSFQCSTQHAYSISHAKGNPVVAPCNWEDANKNAQRQEFHFSFANKIQFKLVLLPKTQPAQFWFKTENKADQAFCFFFFFPFQQIKYVKDKIRSYKSYI